MSAATRWTLVIVGILLGTVAAVVTLIVLAVKTQTKPLPNYYERATHYDNDIAAAERSRGYQWQTSVALKANEVVACFRDKQGTAVVAAVTLKGYHRLAPADALELTLAPSPDGCYRAAFPPKLGWYDITLRAQNAQSDYVAQAVLERT